MNKDMIETLAKDVEGFFDSREEYKESSVPWKREIIFHGLPGVSQAFQAQWSFLWLPCPRFASDLKKVMLIRSLCRTARQSLSRHSCMLYICVKNRFPRSISSLWLAVSLSHLVK